MAKKDKGGKQGRGLMRLMLAALFPLAALCLQLLAWKYLQPYVWLFFYPAVFLASWVGGVVSGVAATVLSAAAVGWFFMPPPHSLTLTQPSSLVALIIFLSMGVLFSLFHERLRKAERREAAMLAEARANLEQSLDERTEELTGIVEELQRKETDLKRSQEIGRIGSWVYELDGRLSWSDELYRLYGLPIGNSPVEFDTFIEMIHPEDRTLMKDWVATCLSGNAPGELQFRLTRPDGTLRFISGRGELERDSQGNPLRMSGTGQDITEQKLAEIALKESESRLRLFIEYAPVPLAMFDRDMRYLLASRRWRSDYGVGDDRDLTGLSHYEVFPEIPPHWKELHRRGLAGEILKEDAEPFVRADGSVQWLRWEIRPWYDYGGEVGGIVIFSEDITQRKCSEEALQKLNEELESRVAQRTEALDESFMELEAQNTELQDAYRELEQETAERIRVVEELRQREQLLVHQSRLAAMGEMLGYIAHQWRQPLNLLGLNLQMLGLSYKHGTFSEELLQESTGKAMAIIQHLSRTIDDFRDFLVLNKEKTLFQVNDVISRTVGLIEENFKKEEIRIEIEPGDPPLVSGFPNEYSHVLLNLLTNARDAFLEHAPPPEGRRIRLRSGAEGDRAAVTITDNAGGIAPEIMDKIFDAYFTTKGPGKGSGVGLFMSKMIIEKNMGGRLTVRNVEGGAEFRIVAR